MEGNLHILVPIHLQDISPLLVNDQSPHHVLMVKLKVKQLLHASSESAAGFTPWLTRGTPYQGGKQGTMRCCAMAYALGCSCLKDWKSQMLQKEAYKKSSQMAFPAYLWIFEVVDQLFNRQVVGQHLKGLWPVLGQGVVHVKPNALQQLGSSGSACSIALPIQLGMKLLRHLGSPELPG